MEYMNLDFKQNISKTICWVLSILSWVLFIITGWIGFFMYIAGTSHDFKLHKIWSFIRLSYNLKSFDISDDSDEISDEISDEQSKQIDNQINSVYLPIQANIHAYTFFFLLIMVVGTVAFVFYFLKSTFKKDEQIYEGMMGQFSRFHFIPIVCACALFISGESSKIVISISSVTSGNNMTVLLQLMNDISSFLKENIVTLIFSLIGLATLIFIHMKTNLGESYIANFSIKNGLYSILIPFFTYCAFYSAIYTGVYNKYNSLNIFSFNENEYYSIFKFMKNCGIAFSIVIGIINIGISFLLKDFIIPIINLLIYLCLAIRFFGRKKEYYEEYENSNEDLKVSKAEGIIDIIMVVLSLVGAALVFILFKKKNNEVSTS